MAAVRRAEATWEGDLTTGSGRVSAASSGTFTDLPVSWASRTETPDGRTSPEELLAAAHAACFSMALSNGLAKAGTPPQRLEVSAEVTFEKVGEAWKVVSSALRVRGTVPGADEAGFRQAAESARDGCPISKTLAGNVELTVEAKLAA
ncbi:MAG TPA: OsmC family peroxiredoxin [Candidatus Limnocylindrales bacterium]|nr:OsmC family peroxiredoxin [Candidatus Limnocylindrales bacterium]